MGENNQFSEGNKIIRISTTGSVMSHYLSPIWSIEECEDA